MKTGQVADSGNRYCQRLGLTLPNLDTALTHPEVKVAHLMALAVLEAGKPLSIEAIAERLGELALPHRLTAAGNTASLCKTWHNQSPLVRDPVDGRFYLDLLAHHEVRWIAYLAPLTYFLPISRGIFMRGEGIGELWIWVVILIAYAILIVSLAAWRFRRKLV